MKTNEREMEKGDLSAPTAMYAGARHTSDALSGIEEYEETALNDPADWEADLLSVYSRAVVPDERHIAAAANAVRRSIVPSLIKIRDLLEDVEKQKAAIWKMDAQVNTLAHRLTQTADRRHGAKNAPDRAQELKLWLDDICAISGLCVELCDRLAEVFDGHDALLSTVGVKMWKRRIEQGLTAKSAAVYAERIRRYEPVQAGSPREAAERGIKRP